jgi:chemotaxis protein methyltransferase CheR
MVAPIAPQLSIAILATDIDADRIDRARTAIFKESSLRELPHAWRDRMFERVGAAYRLRQEFGADVRFVIQDIREARPAEAFDLILCRNLVLTYFDEAQQRRVLKTLVDRLRPGGAFVIGARERLPPNGFELAPWRPERGIYLRATPDIRAAEPPPSPQDPAVR